MITVVVHGTPAPQGSKRHVGHGVMVESSAKVKPWREAVKWAIGQAVVVEPYAGTFPLAGPLRAELVFTVGKPSSAPKRTRTWPAKRPDLDKLIRSTLDGITESGLIRDDAQIVELSAAKRYPSEGDQALAVPGAWIRLTEVTEDEPLSASVPSDPSDPTDPPAPIALRIHQAAAIGNGGGP